MLESLKLLVIARRLDHHLTRFNDLFTRYLDYQRADLMLRGVIIDQPASPPTPQDYTDLYAQTADLVKFDQERSVYAQQLGREPTDDEVLDWMETRDRVG